MCTMQRTKSGNIRKRRFICPSIPKSEACGHCINCLNPSFKQACVVRRQELLAMIEGQRRMEPDAAPDL